MTIRDKIAAYKEAVQEHASDELRMPLTTEGGVKLLSEIDPATLARPERAAVAVALLGAVGEMPKAIDAMLAWTKRFEAAVEALWEALEGQVIDGVTIIRRR